jgi:hypothetical protein
MVFPWTERARLVRRTRVGGQSSRTRPPGPVSSPTAPVRRALKTLFGGAVSKDKVSRVWRKVKAEWDAWNARSLADEPVVRLILDGTARPQGNRNLAAGRPWRARGWSEGLLAVKAMGGESSDAWRSVLDDLIGRGLCRPHFPDRCPARWPVRDRIRGAKLGRQRRHQAVPLHDKHVFDMHVLPAPRRHPQNGPSPADRGSRIEEPRKPLPSTRSTGSSGVSRVSLALRYRWE